MTTAQAESVIHGVIKDIQKACCRKGCDVSETLVAIIIKSTVLDPESKFSPNKPLTSQDVKDLIKICVEKLLNPESPSIDTIKMQVYFELNHVDKAQFLAEHQKALHDRLEPVFQEVSMLKARTAQEVEECYRKLISAVLLLSGTGSPTNLDVVRETTAALRSVLPENEVEAFLHLNMQDRRLQLIELTSVVTGIRLFNKDCAKGGSGIDDLPFLLSNGIPAAVVTLREELDKTRRLAAIYTCLYLKIAAFDPSPDVLSSANVTARVAADQGIIPSNLKSAIINARQYEDLLLKIEGDLKNSMAVVERQHFQFTDILQKLHKLISNRDAVPSVEVFPAFTKMYKVWNQMQNEMVVFSMLTNLLSNLQSFFVGRHLKWSREKIEHLISNTEVIWDEQRALFKEPLSQSERGGFTWIFPDTTEFRMKLELKGYCVWSLIRHQGLLVPSNIGLGVLLLPPTNKFYCFTGLQAIRDFLIAPEHFLKALPDIARRYPELVYLFDLEKHFSKGIPIPEPSELADRPIAKVEAEMQTELHPIERYIDKNYEWNEWQLRKNALKLANMRNKATTSVQTMLSNWRRDNATQVYLPKDQSTATKEDGYTQVPKPSIYIHGLRGCGGIDAAVGATEATKGEQSWCTIYRETKATVVDLTIPVEQQLLGSLQKGSIIWEL